MAIRVATPEEDAAFKAKIPKFYLDPFLPKSVTRELDKIGYSSVNFFGNSKLQEANPYKNPEDQLIKAFSEQGISILDPRHPLNFGTDGGAGGGTGMNIDEILKQILAGGIGGGSGAGGTDLDSLSKGLLFSDRYEAPEATSDKYFQDLLASVSGPSTVDEALKSVEAKGLEQLLADIDRETTGQVASSKMDFMDRGLGGPGQISDIEANAIAQLQTGGARTKAAARTDVLKSGLAREAEKEKAKTAALGLRYQTGAAADTEAQRIAAQGALSESQILSSLTEGERGRGADMTRLIIQLLSSTGLEREKMSRQDKQFYDQLMSSIEQASLGREADYERALLGKPEKKEDNFFDYLETGINVAQTLYGRGGGKGLLTKG